MPEKVVPAGTSVPFAYRLNHWIWHSLDLLYPPVCAGCGTSNYRWCPECRNSTQLMEIHYCQVCGEPQLSKQLDTCVNCKQTRPAYTAMRSWAWFRGPLRQAIHQLKYKRDMALGEVLALPLEQILRIEDWAVDVILPVPLSHKRQSSRGYNQAALLAWPLALRFALPYLPRALKRVRDTLSQTDLSAADRRDNVAGAFEADANQVNACTILLVDDVITTGATMEACAAALRDAGAEHVYAVSVARAGKISLA